MPALRPRVLRPAAALAAAFAAVLSAGLAAPRPAAAQTCTELRFPRGASEARWTGIAHPDHGPCYTFGVVPGQRVTLVLEQGDESGIAISVYDVGDVRDRFDFVATKARYEFGVGFWTRAAEARPFAFRLRIDGTAPRPAPPPPAAREDGRWTLRVAPDGGSVSGQLIVPRGPTVQARCPLQTGRPGFALEFFSLESPLLAWPDGQEGPAFLDIEGGPATLRFPVRLRFEVGQDPAYDTGPLGGAFLDAFAGGRSLVLALADGRPVARFTLEGSAALRRAVRATCGL